MNKVTSCVVGILCYLVGLGGLSAFMLFMGGWSFLPIHINSRPIADNTITAVTLNFVILMLFALHHSFAARSGFKDKLTEYISPALERSIYVLVSGLFMFAFCLLWQPLSGVVWSTHNEVATILLRALHVFGWLFLVAATFEINHFHLMGLKQSISMNPNEGNQFKEVFLYKIVRHPIQTGILLGIWATPYMSMTQFMLSLGFTIYIFIGLYFEEKSLIQRFGDVYMDYKKRVPAVIPFLKMP
ncbi:isoprenylcysteine carboxylmethyltransferase family protein [Pseudoalteromonas sp. YIC-656]|uniref:methyltransferase family protein n=1 Tax=Pseudoalteromonas pernae TaxID=3118054 RepID=UPI0032420AAD